MKLYLDDVRDTPEGWERSYTAAECIERLAMGGVTVLSLDHDLAEEHYTSLEVTEEWTCSLDARTGYAVVLWLEEQVRDNPTFAMPKVHLHTMNPVGREHMRKGLERIERMLEERKR